MNSDDFSERLEHGGKQCGGRYLFPMTCQKFKNPKPKVIQSILNHEELCKI